jgi:hypothetical protein
MNAASAVVPCRSHGSFQEAMKEVRRLSRKGIRVLIQDADSLEPCEAMKLLEYFLHGDAKGPLEPFVTLLSAATRRESVDLWALILPGESGLPDAFLQKLPRDCPQCLSCDEFPHCVGYGVWARTCGTWKPVLARIREAARELRRRRAAP